MVFVAFHHARGPASVCRGNSRELCACMDPMPLAQGTSMRFGGRWSCSTGKVYPALFGLNSETILK